MSKHTITLSCGHETELNIGGPYKERDRKIEWLQANGECQACKAARLEAADAAAGLPALEGSEKQIAWAKQVRREQLPRLQSGIDRLDAMIAKAKALEATGHPVDYIKGVALRDAFAAARLNTSAKYWIDRRERATDNDWAKEFLA